MNTQELMDAVVEHESIILTLSIAQVPIVKSRLSNMRSRQQVKLEEFAEDNRRLEYVEIPIGGEAGKTKIKLRISLVGKGKQLEGIDSLVPAEDF